MYLNKTLKTMENYLSYSSELISHKDFNPFYKKEIGTYSQQKIDFPKNNIQETTIFEECIKERRNHRIGIYQFDEETTILVHLEKKITTKHDNHFVMFCE